MGTAIVNFSRRNAEGASWGVLRDGVIHPLSAQYASHGQLMDHYFSDRAAFDAAAEERSFALEDVILNSPISNNVQLFCQGLNYADHREESGLSDARDEENLIFMKAASSICGPNDTILRPAGCQLLDYEIELALVLKKGAHAPVSITETDLPDYVGGLVLCNDVSARDIMFGSPMLQWFRGKSQRTFCPMGPVLYLLDGADFSELYNLQLTLKLNGELKQSASTGLLIHRPAATLEELSTFASFDAGDCLLTGTPGGVLASGNLKVALAVIFNLKNDAKRRRKFTEAQLAQSRFLEPGDELELTIRSEDGSIDLGVQRNRIADA
jgi:2-keto-4-pentenoate hydratase/2-oxohepta-3-ene-1,7-dioic acid hydratase in catechol pathway